MVADHGWWVILAEFQPSSWAKGSYLNVGVMWLWKAFPGWSFDFCLPGGPRIGAFIKFESEDQFREAAWELAMRAAAETTRLRAAICSIAAVADLLRTRLDRASDGWPLYDAAAAAYLTGNGVEAARLFTVLSQPKPNDHPGATWLRELRKQAAVCAELAIGSRLGESLVAQIEQSRTALGLPPAHISLHSAERVQ